MSPLRRFQMLALKRRKKGGSKRYVAKRSRKYRRSVTRATRKVAYRSRSGRVMSVVSGGSVDHNLCLENSFAAVGGGLPIGLSCDFLCCGDVSIQDITLSHLTANNLLPTQTINLIDDDIFEKYKSLYKFACVKRIYVKFYPAITQGQVVQSADGTVPNAVTAVMSIECIRDMVEYNKDYPLSVDGERDALNRKKSKEYSMYRPWTYSFVPSVKPIKDTSVESHNVYWKTRMKPWFELDDYTTCPSYENLAFIMRMRVPQYSGVPVAVGDPLEVNEWPVPGKYASIGRLQFSCKMMFSGPRF